MLNICKFYYKYLFTKQVIIVFVLINIFYILAMLYSSGVFMGYSLMDINNYEYGLTYFNDFVLITKLISIIVAILITILLFRESSSNLAKYIIDKPTKKLLVVISKYLVSVFISVLFLSFLFSSYYLITYFFTPYSLCNNTIIRLYLGILQQMITYISITFCLLCIIGNMLVSLVPIILFWFMEANPYYSYLEVSNITKILYSYIPNLLYFDNEYILVGDTFSYMLFNIITILLAIFISLNKEIN